ncbi:MAG: hypothetical protein HOH74_07865, partial [Gemmatimonadetes bacterium]|nr:hypothetical protein [Gemmatimonadota bacterium]
MSEPLTDDWNLSALIIQEEGKPQGVIAKYLRMSLSLRFGLEVIESNSVVDACTLMQQKADSILCAFIVQQQEVGSKTLINALSQKSKVPLFLVLPRRNLDKTREVFAKIHNVYFASWEDAFKRNDGSLQKTLDRGFLANRICPLLDPQTALSFTDLQQNVQQRVRNLDTIPTLPSVVLRIIELIED